MRAARLTLRALDLVAATLVLAATAPLALLGLLAALRGPGACTARVGAPGQTGRVLLLPPGTWLPRWVSTLPLWLEVLRGRFAAVGGGAWRDHARVEPPLLPGVVSLAELRAATGIARADRRALDQELAARWGPRAWLAVALRALLLLPLATLRAGRPAGALEVDGIPLENAAMTDLLAAIERAARTRRRLWGAFVNADCVNLARRDAAYGAALRRCDVVVPDGIGVRLAARLDGQAMGENLVGTDLLPGLCAASARAGLRLFLLGGAPGVAEEAARRLAERHPGARLAGAHHGYFEPASPEERAALEAVERASPDVLLVGMGAPRQELWLARHAEALRPPVRLGVGGLFDYTAGRVARAPQWVRELGLEWAFRLWQEPRRLWRRYLVGNVVFVVTAAASRLRPFRPGPAGEAA